MQLVEGWRKAHSWWSIRLAAIIAVAPEAYNQLSTLQAIIPQLWFNRGMALLGGLIILGRLLQQVRTAETAGASSADPPSSAK